MDELVALLRNAVANAEFLDLPSRPVSARRLRSRYAAWERVRICPKTVCRTEALAPLVSYLQGRLEAYANQESRLQNSDRFGAAQEHPS